MQGLMSAPFYSYPATVPCGLQHASGTDTVASIGMLRCWLTVLVWRGDAGSEHDSSIVVMCDIGFTIEYFVNNVATFCLFITPSPGRQPAGFFSRVCRCGLCHALNTVTALACRHVARWAVVVGACGSGASAKVHGIQARSFAPDSNLCDADLLGPHQGIHVDPGRLGPKALMATSSGMGVGFVRFPPINGAGLRGAEPVIVDSVALLTLPPPYPARAPSAQPLPACDTTAADGRFNSCVTGQLMDTQREHPRRSWRSE